MRTTRLGVLATIGILACSPRAPEADPDRPAPGPGPAAVAGDTAAPDTLPYRIVSPAPGDEWREGGSYVIRWTSARGGAVNVAAAVGGKDRGHLAMRLPAGTDSLAWTVPAGFVTGFGPERSDAVRIRIEDAGDPAMGVTSEPFTIRGAGDATVPR